MSWRMRRNRANRGVPFAVRPLYRYVTQLPIGGGRARSASLKPLPMRNCNPSGRRTTSAPSCPAYFP
jgi:hypothetical protein